MQVAIRFIFPLIFYKPFHLVQRIYIRSADALIGISILFLVYHFSSLLSDAPNNQYTIWIHIHADWSSIFLFLVSPRGILILCYFKMPFPFLSRFTHHTSKRSTHVMVYQCNIYSMRYRFFMRERGPRSLREIPFCLVERAILPSIPLIILISLNKYRKDVELSNGYCTSETTVVHNDNWRSIYVL